MQGTAKPGDLRIQIAGWTGSLPWSGLLGCWAGTYSKAIKTGELVGCLLSLELPLTSGKTKASIQIPRIFLETMSKCRKVKTSKSWPTRMCTDKPGLHSIGGLKLQISSEFSAGNVPSFFLKLPQHQPFPMENCDHGKTSTRTSYHSCISKLQKCTGFQDFKGLGTRVHIYSDKMCLQTQPRKSPSILHFRSKTPDGPYGI